MSDKGQFRKIRVFLACPSDVGEERAVLVRVIERLNKGAANDVGVVLELAEWRDVAPNMGKAEDVVIDQLPVESWDIFIGILRHRFGQPTGNVDPSTGRPYESGTEEEFKLAVRAWKKGHRPRILFYRCTRPALDPETLDQLQLERVKQFLHSSMQSEE